MNLPKVVGGKRLRCLSLSVNQSITPLSNATMELLKEDELPVRTFVELSTPNGITEVYRTRQPQSNKESGTVTVQLDHAICEIGDYLTSSSANQEMTLADAIADIFSYYDGTHWQLATITANDTVTVDYDHDNVLEQLLAVMAQVPQYYLSFDFSTTPWTLDIEEKDNTVTGEGRMSRNLAAASVKEDDKDLCTRVYVKGLPKPSGREDEEDAIGYMDADTISLYGVIEKDASNGDLTQAQATRLATAYLNAHKHPKRSVELDGYDLSEITGENFDKFITAKKFRLVVPEDNLVIEDYITKISWADPLNTPQANVIIGDEIDATINFIQDQISNTKTTRRNKRKTDKEVSGLGHLIEETDSYWRSTYWDTINSLRGEVIQTAESWSAKYENFATSLRGEVVATATSWSEKYQDFANSLRGEVVTTAASWSAKYENFATSLRGEVVATATSWSEKYNDFANSLRGEVVTTAESWRAVYEDFSSSVRSELSVTATTISAVINGTGSNAKIKPAAIKASIDADTGSLIELSASRIKLDGDTYLSGKLTIDSSSNSLKVTGSEIVDGSITVRGLNGGGGGSVSATNYTVYAGGKITFNGASSGQSWTLDSTALVGLLKAVQITPVSGTNTYKLQYKSFTADNWVDAGSFSRATALSGTWSGGKITMSANASNVPNLVHVIKGGDPSWSGNIATVKIYAYTDTNPEQLIGETGRSITVDASARYTAGYNGAHLSADWNAADTQLQITKVSTGSTNSMSFSIGAEASITYNSNTHKYTAIAQATVDGFVHGNADSDISGTEAYGDGHDDGYSVGYGDGYDAGYDDGYDDGSSGGSASYDLSNVVCNNNWPASQTINSFFGAGTFKETQSIVFPNSANQYHRYITFKIDNKKYLLYQ